jgi:hypothetical protein
MQTKRASIATSMSCFWVVVAIAGCFRIETTSSDDSNPLPDAFVPPTSLQGSIPCGASTCGSGTVCAHFSAGIDAGVPGNYDTCEIVPSGCRVSDCYGSACPACIAQLCSSLSYTEYFRLEGRNLYCPGV